MANKRTHWLRMNEKFKYYEEYKEFQVHSTASKCVYFPSNHELEVSNRFDIQTCKSQEVRDLNRC